MIGKILVRTAIATGAVAGAVHLVRKYNLTEKAAKGAEAFIAKGIGLTDELLTKFDEKTKESASQTKAGTEDSLSSHLNRLLDLAQKGAKGAQSGEWKAGAEDTWAAATRKDNGS